MDERGQTETDPEKVMRIWKEFSARVANHDDKQEEGIFDDDHRDRVEEQLR